MGDGKKSSAKDKYLNKNSTKNGILSIVGAITHKIGISALWVLANLVTYLISYLRKFPENNSLTLIYTYFFAPILSTTLTGFMPVCGIIEFKLGCQKAIIIGALVIMLGYTILYVSKNIFLDMFATFLFGIGLSISTTLSTKNALLYFFNQKGTIGGILELISSGLSAAHNKIAETIINPDSLEPTVTPDNDNTQKFYDVAMSENVLNFYLFELGTYGISTLLTLLFLIPYDEKAAKKLSKELKKKSEQKEENTAINDDENKKKETNPDGNLIVEDYSTPTKEKEANAPLLPGDEEAKPNEAKRYQVSDADNEEYGADKIENYNFQKGDKVIAIPEVGAGVLDANPVSGNISMSVTAVNYSTAHTKRALKSFRVWKLFILNLCYYLALNLILVMWRPVGINQGISTKTLQLIATLNFIMTSIGTPFFGFLSDKLPFRILYTIIGVLTSLIGFTFCLSFDSEVLFSIMVCGMNFLLGGYISALPPHYMKVFGMKYYVEIGGVIGLACLIMGPLTAFFSFFLENSVGSVSTEDESSETAEQESKEAKLLAYKIIFNSGAALNIVAIIVGLLESDDEFEYGM